MLSLLKKFRLFPSFKKNKEKSDISVTKALKKIDFISFQKCLNYRINDRKYFINALTHRSFLKIKRDSASQTLTSNERLEFLGDAVLDLVVAEFLYKNFPGNEEGDLTKFRSILVNKRFLAERAKSIRLQDFLLASNTALRSISEGYDAILADAYEALIGAIFLDSGYEAVKKFITQEIFIKLDIKWLNQFDENYKSKFLEFSQANTEYIPEYKVIKEEGPEHHKLFTVEVHLADNCLGSGKGKSKKQAEQEAAKNALQNLDTLEKIGILKKKK